MTTKQQEDSLEAVVAEMLKSNWSAERARGKRLESLIQQREPVAWIYEDALPKDMTFSQYADWFSASKVIDGVRMGPPLPPPPAKEHT